MAKNNFIFAATLVLSAMFSMCITACTDEETEERDHHYDYIQRTTKTHAFDKDMEVSVLIAEDIVDLYDLSVQFHYDGNTIKEKLADLNNLKSVTVYSTDKEPIIYTYREYGISKTFGDLPLDIRVIATPKDDALAAVELMPEDKKFAFVFETQITNLNDALDRMYNKPDKKDNYGMDRDTLIETLQLGEYFIKEVNY